MPVVRPVLIAVLGCLALFASPVHASDDDDRPAYVLESGSIAHNRVVALGRDLVVLGEARSHAVAIDGDLRVAGRVDGDVIVLDGNVQLDAAARVEGDVFVLGGRIETATGAVINGRSVAYPDAAAAWITLLEGPTLGLEPNSPVLLGAKLALIAFWALVLLICFGFGGSELLSTSMSVRDEPFRNFIVGITAVAGMVLTALLVSAVAGPYLALPLLVLVVVAALTLRFWGMVAVFHTAGATLCRLVGRPRVLPMTAACIGLLAMGLLKFIPYVGVWTWSVATFIGVGATLTTRFGRRGMWFGPVVRADLA
ncbi:MAG: polymer-forming cytoskeletal protein [Acidobacteriota bacterium]